MVVEEAIYQTEGQDLLLVGVPDVTIQKAKGTQSASEATLGMTVAQPILFDLPMPDVVRQGYLEIREVATSEVVTIIEVLSPTHKLLAKADEPTKQSVRSF